VDDSTLVGGPQVSVTGTRLKQISSVSFQPDRTEKAKTQLAQAPQVHFDHNQHMFNEQSELPEPDNYASKDQIQ
jgi:hypothetical protein